MLTPFTRIQRSLGSVSQATWRTVLLTSLAVTAGLWGLRQTGTVLESLEINTWDRMTRFAAGDSPDERLLVVGVTEQDLQKYGYPLSDGTLAQLLQTLGQQQPRAIGVDIIRDIAQGSGRESLLQEFQTPNVIAVCKVGAGEDTGYPPPPGVPKSRLGFSNFPADPGGVLRRGLLAMVPPPLPAAAPDNPCQDDAEPIYSLGFQVAQLYLRDEGMPLPAGPTDLIRLGNVVFEPLQPTSGGYQHADTGGYQMLLRYRSPDAIAPQVTLDQVLTHQVGADQVRDRIILVGYVAESVHDLFPTPFSAGQRDNQATPGVIIHAQLTSQVLGAVLDGVPLPWAWPQWAEIVWIGGWALAGGILAGSIRHPLGLGLGTLVALGLSTGLGYGAFLQAGWIPVAAPALAFVITLGSVILVDRYAQTLSNQIKGFLKLDIEIDEVEKESALAEITESDYFQKLQESGEKLRKQKEVPDEAPAGDTPTVNPAPNPAPDPGAALASASDLDPGQPQSQPRPRPRRDILAELQQEDTPRLEPLPEPTQPSANPTAPLAPQDSPRAEPATPAEPTTDSAAVESLDDFFLNLQQKRPNSPGD